MITAGQALMIALAAALQHIGSQPAGNAFVDLHDGVYQVALIPVTNAAPGGLLIAVDHATGTSAPPRVTADARRPERRTGESSISIAVAYDTAIAALQGFENYDKQGRLTIVLRRDHYEVTFPPIVTGPMSRGIDYAYQVWVDAATSRVVKVLVPG